MKRNRHTQSLNIPNSRWLAYATAGAATAFGVVEPADAEIHYSGPMHQRFPTFPGSVNFDLHHSARLTFQTYLAYNFLFSVARAAVSGQFRGYNPSGFFPYVSRLSAGIPVSQGDFLGTPQSRTGLLGTSYGLGPWATNHGWPHRIGFIGFRFDSGLGKQYGWVRLRVQPNHGHFFNVVILDYAWGDPGDPILTGQRSSSGEMVDATPLNGSLGLLALGGVGLDAWRIERAKSAKSQP